MTVNGTVTEQDRYTNQLEQTLDLFQERIAELEFRQEDQGWARLDSSDADYEFSSDSLRRIVARSRLFFLHNPLINRAVSLQSDYVFAQGLNIQATNDKINDVLQEFLDDPVNQKEFTSHRARLMKEQTLMLDGNVFFILFTDKSTGHVSIRSVLVGEITDIISNPDDAAEVWYYQRTWVSKDAHTMRVETKTVYYPDMNYMPATQPANFRDKPVQWDSPIYHVSAGGLAKSKYGVPETYAALDWAQAHRKVLENWATIIQAYALFAFRLTTPGGRSSIAAAKTKLGTTVGMAGGTVIENNPAPVAGAIFASSKDGTDIEPIKTAGATTSAKDARELRLMVASAMGIPDTMLSGDADTGNLATAQTLDRPTELKFRSRQQLWTDVYKDIFKYVIKWAIIAPKGLLAKLVTSSIGPNGTLVYNPKIDPKTGKPIDLHVEVVFPPILEHSILDRIKAVTEAVTLDGKTFAVDSPELAKITMRLMLQALGLNDVDELVTTIFSNVDPNAPQPTDQPPTNPTDQPVSNTNGAEDARIAG